MGTKIFTSPRPFRNLLEVRRQCLRYPQSLGIDVGHRKIEVRGNLFILNPKLISPEHREAWMRALRTSALLNQDGLCICGEQKPFELHHALLSKRDVQGCDVYTKWLINHSYNVVMLHPDCHQKVTRERCFEFLETIYGDVVEPWYHSFPIQKRIL